MWTRVRARERERRERRAPRLGPAWDRNLIRRGDARDARKWNYRRARALWARNSGLIKAILRANAQWQPSRPVRERERERDGTSWQKPSGRDRRETAAGNRCARSQLLRGAVRKEEEEGSRRAFEAPACIVGRERKIYVLIVSNFRGAG